MRSDNLDLAVYDTDKIGNRYLERYDPILEPWVNKKVKLLEIGIDKGGSLLKWRDYISQGTNFGNDIYTPKYLPPEKMRLTLAN